MNSDIVKLLPDSVANQIAAGEVIQRPASVIKELVENAVDAGATAITIILKDAGRTLIQVIDNGCGMSPTDARMAFERHATSKISAASDLFALHTMGFRGEALPSIAAVAQIDLRSMRHNDEIGTRVLISESKFESQEAAACTPGTNLMVKNIFFHLPARRKFLKKDSVELGHILREFERLALVNTSVDFTLIHNDVTLHQILAGTFKQRIAALFGKNIENQIAAINTETVLVKISGFIAMPRHAKKRGAQQYFFVNGRNMRHPYFHKAVLSCYDQLIAPDAQPSYFINFEVDPSTIDVNIHPQKHEIKFEHEQAIWQILVAAIKETLGRVHAAGALDFDQDDAPDIPIFDPSTNADAPSIEIDTQYNPFDVPVIEHQQLNIHTNNYTQRSHPDYNWDKLYDNFSQRRGSAINDTIDADPTIAAPTESRGHRPSQLNWHTPDESVDSHLNQTTEQRQPQLNEYSTTQASSCLQLRNRYIATPTSKGLMLIDQHRAHTRILHDRYIDALDKGSIATQKVIFPETLTLSPAQNAILTEIATSLPDLGFDLSYLGDSIWVINGTPSILPDKANPTEILMQFINDAENSNELSTQSIIAPFALSMARATAVKHGQALSITEMDSIIADLFRSTSPQHTPDGLTILSVIPYDYISSLFA